MSLVPVDHPSFNAPANPARADWIELMHPAAELANQIAQTDFVPSEFRNKPAAIAACILYGAEIGIGPMMSLAKVDIVKGRPAPRAELGRALALAAGHELWVEESTNTRVTISGKRRGSSHVHTVTWTMDDAKKAGIAGNPTYAKYPRQMLLARASGELVKMMCPEVLGGIQMFAEEAADLDDRDTPVITSAPAEASAPATTTRKRSRPKPAEATERAADEPAETTATATATTDTDVDDTKPSPAQTAMAMAAFGEIGITDRDDRLAATAALIGHPCGSWKELTRNEASTVIDGLERIKAGGISFTINDDGVWTSVATDDELLDGGDDAA